MVEEAKERSYRVEGFIPSGDFHLASGRVRTSRNIMASSADEARQKAYDGEFEDVLSVDGSIV